MLTLVLAIATLQSADDAVRRLKADDLSERDRAATELRRLGDSARPALERAALDPDADVAGRAARVLRAIEIEMRVSPAVRAVLPGVVDRLLDDPQAWVQAFLAACERAETGPPGLTARDLAPLAKEAIHHMARDDARSVTERISRWRLREAARGLVHFIRPGDRAGRDALVELHVAAVVPDLIRLMVEGDATSAETLRQLRAPAHSPEIRRLLRHRDAAVRQGAADILSAWRDAESRPEFLRLLDDPISSVRLEAAYAVGVVGRPEDAELLAARLDDENADVRRVTAYSLPKIAGRAAAPRLERLLRDPDPSVRYETVEVLSRLDARACAPALRKLLADASSDVRRAAIFATGRLGDRDAIPALIELVRDVEDADHALTALRELGAREAVPLLMEMTYSDAAARTLAVVGAAGEAAAMERRLRDPDDGMRWRALVVVAGIRKADALAHVERALGDPSQAVHTTAFQLLGEIAPERADQVALKELADETSPLRRAALQRVRQRMLCGATDTLRAWAREERDAWTLLAVANTLLALGVTDAAPELAGRLPSLRDSERAWVARAACQLGSREAAHVVIESSWRDGGG